MHTYDKFITPDIFIVDFWYKLTKAEYYSRKLPCGAKAAHKTKRIVNKLKDVTGSSRASKCQFIAVGPGAS